MLYLLVVVHLKFFSIFFVDDNIFPMDSQFKTLLTQKSYDPIQLMYEVTMTSCNCYITGIFQSFQN